MQNVIVLNGKWRKRRVDDFASAINRSSAMTASSQRSPSQAPFERSVFYNLRYAGISSFDRLGWRRKSLSHLCKHYVFVCLNELRNSFAVIESSLVSRVPTRASFYHCRLQLPGQAILIQRSWAATVGIGDAGRRNVDWGHEILIQRVHAYDLAETRGCTQRCNQHVLGLSW